MAAVNWRTINVDALDPESSQNFDLSTLLPAGIRPVSTADVQALDTQIRQQSRGGDQQGALLTALREVPYGADFQGKELHLATVIDILQSIRQTDMTPVLTSIRNSTDGVELCDTLMKYLYKGMAQPSTKEPSSAKTVPQSAGFSQMAGRMSNADSQGHAMSVLLSWHEKLVEIAGPGSIVRVMSDRRTV